MEDREITNYEEKLTEALNNLKTSTDLEFVSSPIAANKKKVVFDVTDVDKSNDLNDSFDMFEVDGYLVYNEEHSLKNNGR